MQEYRLKYTPRIRKFAKAFAPLYFDDFAASGLALAKLIMAFGQQKGCKQRNFKNALATDRCDPALTHLGVRFACQNAKRNEINTRPGCYL